MVQRGQFLERPALIASGEHTLEGLWHRGTASPSVLLIPPRPGFGSMDAAVLNELAFACSRRGHPSLRFNFGGVGASQGKSNTLAQLARDARAALRLLRQSSGFQPTAVVGLGTGGEVALRLARDATRLCLISPPPELVLPEVSTEILFALAESDPGRARWSSQCAAQGDRLALIEGADPAWNRGLVQLAREVVGFVSER